MKTFRALLITLAAAASPLAGATIATAQVGQMDVHASIGAIMNAGTRADRVKSIKKVPSVGVVRLDLAPPMSFNTDIPSRSEYRILVSRNAAGVNKMRRALAANPVTRAALAKRGISPSQVAGAQISSNGSLRLYIFSY